MDSAERARIETAVRVAAEAERHYRALQSPVPIVGVYGLAAVIAAIFGAWLGWIAAGVSLIVVAVLLEGCGFGFSMYKELRERADSAAEEKARLIATLDGR